MPTAAALSGLAGLPTRDLGREGSSRLNMDLCNDALLGMQGGDMIISGTHLGALEQGSCEGHQLLLSSRQGRSASRQLHVKAGRRILHQPRQIGSAQGPPDLGVVIILKGVQIAAHRTCEQHWHLQATMERNQC